MKNVLLIDFDNEAKAYEGFSKIKDVNVDGAEVLQAALVREDEGSLEIKESVGVDEDSASGTLAGGAIGALLGLFTGGFGWALWGAIGLIIGAMFDDHDDHEEDSLLTDMSKKIHNNHLSIIAVADEGNYDIINHQMDGLNATITRYAMADIEEEIEEAKELNKEVAKEARQKLREKKAAARHKRWEERREKIKEDFHHDKKETDDKKDNQ